jgi:electron transport complex protein RnfC
MLKTFRLGGIHPPAQKLSSGVAVVDLPIPAKVTIPLSQHLGAPATPLVKKGDRVLAGQLIGQASGFISANVHSSVSGVVEKIEDVMDASGLKRASVVIQVDGDEWLPDIDRSATIVRDITMSSTQIIECIEKSGIVGMGGATFPTHIKLVPPPGKKCDTLIINGAECEPFLTSDERLMIEKGEELLIGVSLLMKALQVQKAIIGIEKNKPQAIEVLQQQVVNFQGIEVISLKEQYPQGGEKQLIESCTGRRVPSGKLPVEVGVVVQNIGTVLAVYEAVQKNKPLVDRVVTITGKAVAKPGNFRVRMGTSVSVLIEAAGGLPAGITKILSGGPMMGKALVSVEVPVTKGTSGIVLMMEDESHRKPMLQCIRCAKCVDVCPMGLSPYLLMAYSQKAMWSEAEEEMVTDCIECGSCSYTCPSQRPLLDYIRLGKGTVNQLARQRKL